MTEFTDWVESLIATWTRPIVALVALCFVWMAAVLDSTEPLIESLTTGLLWCGLMVMSAAFSACVAYGLAKLIRGAANFRQLFLLYIPGACLGLVIHWSQASLVRLHPEGTTLPSMMASVQGIVQCVVLVMSLRLIRGFKTKSITILAGILGCLSLLHLLQGRDAPEPRWATVKPSIELNVVPRRAPASAYVSESQLTSEIEKSLSALQSGKSH